MIRNDQQNTADSIDERLQEPQKEILKKANNKEAFDEALVKYQLERVIVQDDHFTVELKSGLKIEING